MTKPILVVMAAGMGSRFGGLKQIEPVGPKGEIILEYSVFDAARAGFERVIFIIKEEMKEDFSARINKRVFDLLEVSFAYQRLEDLPATGKIPAGREKPWGTGHAILAARDLIDAPFAVINADDYYGPESFQIMYEFLQAENNKDTGYGMCSWELANTLSEHGHVSRGVCSLSPDSYLESIKETKKIYKSEKGGRYSPDNDLSWIELAPKTLVSMNFWGLPASFLLELQHRFPTFLKEDLQANPLKAEFLLPEIIDSLIKEDKIKVKVMPVKDRWYGITYQEDKALVSAALASLTRQGMYPDSLWTEI